MMIKSFKLSDLVLIQAGFVFGILERSLNPVPLAIHLYKSSQISTASINNQGITVFDFFIFVLSCNQYLTRNYSVALLAVDPDFLIENIKLQCPPLCLPNL